MITVLTALFLLWSAGTARADPISIAILTFVGIEASAVAVSVTTFALTIAAGYAANFATSYLIKATSKAPEDIAQTQAEEVGGTGRTGKIRAGGTVPRSFIVGRWMTAGSLVYVNTYGEVDGTPNAWLTMVVALSDMPSQRVHQLLVNGAYTSWDPEAPQGVDYDIPEFTVGGAPYLKMRWYGGTQVAADSALVALFGSDLDRPWTSRMVGEGITYVVMTARINDELFSGFPEFRFVVDGMRLYDRRSDSTAGGSGSQRWSDPTTWAWTSNNAVIVENLFRGIHYNGQWLYGAQTISNAQLPFASWSAAANECDADIDLAEGGTEPQYQAGGEIIVSTQPVTTIEELLKAGNGKIAEVGGVFKPRFGAAGAAVLSFTDADILTSDAQTFDPFPSMSQSVNHLTARYTSPGESWNEKDAPALVNDDYETYDGRRNTANLNYGFVSSGTQVQRLMRSELQNNRAWRLHTLPMPPDVQPLEPLDVVSWTSARNGYEDKLFEVISADDQPNLTMAISLKEVDPNAYDWDPNTHERPVIDGTIVTLRPAPQPIVDWFAEPYTLTAHGLARPAILIGWDPNVDDVDGIRYEVRLADTLEVIARGSAELHAFMAGELIVSQSLLPNTNYGVRGQYRPASARPVSWSDWLSVTTPDTRVDRDELSERLDALIRQVEERLPSDLSTIQAEVEKLSGSLASQTSILTEFGGRIRQAVGARYQENAAGVETALLATADVSGALAAFQTLVFADSAFGSAKGRFRIVASSTASGALATISLEVSASASPSDVWHPSGIYIDAMTGFSRIRLVADQVRIATSATAAGDLIFEAGTALGVPGTVMRRALIGDAYIDNAAIANLAVTGAKIANATIGGAKIGNLEVDTIHLKNEAVAVPLSVGLAAAISGFTTTGFATIMEGDMSFVAVNGSAVAISFMSNLYNTNQTATGTTHQFGTYRVLVNGLTVDQSTVDLWVQGQYTRHTMVAMGQVTGTGVLQTVNFRLQLSNWVTSDIMLGSRFLAVAYKR